MQRLTGYTIGVEIGNYVDYELSSGKQLSYYRKSSGFELGRPRLEDVATGVISWDSIFKTCMRKEQFVGWLAGIFIHFNF